MPINYVKNRFFGEIDDNYQTGTLVSDTALTITITVPDDEIWYLHGGLAINGDNVSRHVSIEIRNENNEYIYHYASVSVGATTSRVFPMFLQDMKTGISKLPLKPGWKIRFYFASGGPSSGGTAKVSAIVEKFKIK